jgi:hypothetical protein
MKQTVLYNGIRGVRLIGNDLVDIEGKELAKLKIEAEMFFLLDPGAYGVALELKGIKNADSTECYKIIMTKEGGAKWNQFYDVKTGFKIKEVKEVETPRGKFMQETHFSNYKEVDGLKFPFKLEQSVGKQTIELTVSSVTLNDGLDDSIFEITE